MDFEIIASGSNGNAVVLGNSILIDCGIPCKTIQPHSKGLQLVLLTHTHLDHISPATVRRLALERPAIRWACGEWMVGLLVGCGVSKKQIDVFANGQTSQYHENLRLTMYEIPHDVRNAAWVVYLGGKTAFYATDTNSLDHIHVPGLDLYMVEANYKEEELATRIREMKNPFEYIHFSRKLNYHLSREKANEFICRNAGPHSKFAYMHMEEFQPEPEMLAQYRDKFPWLFAGH